MKKAGALVLLLGALAPCEANGQDGGRRLKLEDYLEMESVANPRISPDGRQVVYERGWVDKMKDRRQSSLWIMDADGTRNRFLVEGSSAVWSPDGTRVAYLAEGQPDGTQIWVKYLDAGAPRRSAAPRKPPPTWRGARTGRSSPSACWCPTGSAGRSARPESRRAPPGRSSPG